MKNAETLTKCKHCDYKSCNLLGVSFHMRKIHGVEMILNPLRFECPKCFQKFKSCFHMLTHVKTIHLKAKKKCLECDKFFSVNIY